MYMYVHVHIHVHVYACILEDTNEIVGFTATHSSDVVYFTDDVIQFPNIATNYGDYYNAETSIFICPRDGMYAFFQYHTWCRYRYTGLHDSGHDRPCGNAFTFDI